MRTFTLGCIFAIPNVANPTPVPVASLKGCKVSVKQSKKGFPREPARHHRRRRRRARLVDRDRQRGLPRLCVPPGRGRYGGEGGILPAIAEQQTIATAAFTVSQSAVFTEDGGVLDLTAGKWMTRVASAPAAKQYSGPAAGVYTCNAADNGHVVWVTYSYTPASPVGETTTVSNSIQSQAIPYKLRVYNPWT
jgi:hypothetical protein